MNVSSLRMFKDLLALSIILLFPALSHASPKLDEAKRAYQQLQIPKAESIYKDILNENGSDKESQFEALIGLARVKQLMGSASESKRYLKEAIKLAPWKKLSKEEFPPSFTQLHEEIRKGEIGERGSLAITTDPPFVALKIEGIKLGYSPITIPEMPVGTYRIEASMSGYSKESETVSIVKGGKRILSLNLQPEIAKNSVVLQKTDSKEVSRIIPITKSSNKRDEKIASNKGGWWSRPWIWGSTLIVIGGIAAYAFSQAGSDSAPQGAISISLP